MRRVYDDVEIEKYIKGEKEGSEMIVIAWSQLTACMYT